MRKNIVVGNWKMNLKRKESLELVEEVISMLKNNNVEVVFAPSYTYLYKVNKMCTDLSYVHTASQNISKNKNGAFTGEVSAEMIHSLGVKYIILGHSERREYFNETNTDLRTKVDLSLSNNLDVIFCCGESLKQRESGVHFDWIKSQIVESLFHLTEEEFSKIVIAYEPIWAIGTGVTASSSQAEEIHAYIRSVISDKYGENVSANCSILYGGSCKPNNARELFSKENIDGGLIGGASLDANSFVEIIKSFQ
ncbi:MAG: triose-phosphate isomerase [Flavobacteriales bacterium]|nr:triose-phosphate isomerase [Flavobacteriales bacterium]|tara:strand:- start:1803 stop:2558 length:756 start_codon:yes stop_codon:yes gene_type:complete